VLLVSGGSGGPALERLARERLVNSFCLTSAQQRTGTTYHLKEERLRSSLILTHSVFVRNKPHLWENLGMSDPIDGAYRHHFGISLPNSGDAGMIDHDDCNSCTVGVVGN